MKKISNITIGFVCAALIVVVVFSYLYIFEKRSGVSVNALSSTTLCKEFFNFREAMQASRDVCFLDLQNQQLTGSLPGEIRFMYNLMELHVNNNKMTGIPAEIGQLKSLTVLDYSANQLDTMPNEIAHLTKLQFFSLANNKYRELPESITQISSLVTLDVSYNSITSLPVSIGNLKNLEELRLVGNPLSFKEIEKVQQLLPHVRIIK